MQLFKHMEVLLMLAFGVLCATVAWHPDDTRQRAPMGDVAGPVAAAVTVAATAANTAANTAATAANTLHSQVAAPMPIVQIIGHRLTPEERGNGRANTAAAVAD